jgi:hypothetical protein
LLGVLSGDLGRLAWSGHVRGISAMRVDISYTVS